MTREAKHDHTSYLGTVWIKVKCIALILIRKRNMIVG